MSPAPKMRFANGLRVVRNGMQKGSFARRILASAALSLVFGVGPHSPAVNRLERLWTPVAPPRAVSDLIPAPPDVSAFECLRQPRAYPVSLRQKDLTTILNAGPHEMAFALTGGGAPELVVAASVAPRDFSRLRVHPLAGRTLRVSDNSMSASPVVMIGEVLWRRRFAADTAIVGKSILLSAHAYRVVGILPATFRFPYASDPVEIWLPVAQDPRLRESPAGGETARLKQLTTSASPSESPNLRPAPQPSPALPPLWRNVVPVAPVAPAAPAVSLAPLAPLVPAVRAKVTITSQE